MYINPLTIVANKLSRKLRNAGSPTTGAEAAKLHEICSSNNGIDILTAKKLYIKAGYIPFMGYPLERSED